MRGDDRIRETEALLGRVDVLDRLCRSPAHIRDLVEETGQSRSTINRALNDLEAIDLVERGEDGVEPTTAGRLARDRLESFLTDFDDVLAAEAVLDPLPTEAGIDPDVVAGCEPILAADPAPYRPLERIYDDLSAAEHYRALVPTLEDPRHVRLLYEHVVTEGNPAELVVTPEVFETLGEEFLGQVAAMAKEDGFSVFVGPVPPFGLGLFEREPGSEKPPTAHVVVHNESGGVHGTLVNEAAPAVQWARDQYVATRNDATERTEELADDPDGSDRATDPDGGLASIGQSLPASLEREGFVSVDVSYFRDEPVADPATAWRAGLSLAEVHTGYAIPRPDAGGDPSPDDDAGGDPSPDDDGDGDPSPDDDGDGDPSPDDDGDLASAISAELTGGNDCVVLGPPGSGKSTVCKTVACKWYDADRGPVLYREHDRGRSLASVEDLVATITAADGHALVVVEDAVRPDANRIFEARDRLEAREDVSFLLDAREPEWRDRPGPAADVTALEVVHVPPMSETDCERLVEQFRRTVGRSIDVPVAQLWAEVRDSATADGDADTNELLRLVHRLATYADPLADGPTALEEAVAAVYDELVDDEVALSVCILANALNAAGVGVERGLLYAVADPDEFDAVDAACDHLEGRVLFPRSDGSGRTVHEVWSTTFLAHLLDAEGEEAAARRFGATVSALLALADDSARCERLAAQVGESDALAEAANHPTRWADELVEALYRSSREHAQMAPLFGDGEHDSIDLPAACSDRIREARPRWLGELFLAGGFYDEAERAYERLPREDPERGIERRLGLARIAIERGAFEDAEAHCRAGLEDVEGGDHDGGEVEGGDHDGGEVEGGDHDGGEIEEGDHDGGEVLAARTRLLLGETLHEQGAFADAETAYRTALDRFEALERTHWIATTHRKLGELAFDRAAYDEAMEAFEASLELVRALDDRRGEASVLNDVAGIHYRRGEYDRALELYERTLQIRRALGDSHGQAKSLYNLGLVVQRDEDVEYAAELFERSLRRYEAVDDRQGQAKVYQALAHLADIENDLDRAQECNERSLELMREIGDAFGESTSLGNLGITHRHRGELATAESLTRESLELAREMENRDQEARALHNLGNVAADRGELDRAAGLYDESIEILEEHGNRHAVAKTLFRLGDLELDRGAHERARDVVEDVVGVATELDAGQLLAKGERLLAACALLEGRTDRAETLLNTVDERGIDDRGVLGCRARLTRAKLACERGNHRDALKAAELTVEDLTELGRPIWEARGRLVHGRIAADADELELARESLSSALDAFEEIGAYHDALVALELLVETYPEEDEHVERWTRRGRELLSEAPEEVAERQAGRFEGDP